MNYKTINKNTKTKNINILNQIQKLLDRHQIDSAEQYLREYIIKNEVSEYRILLKYAQILRMQVRYDEAIDILEKLLLTENKNYALYELTMIFVLKNDFKKAAEYIQQLKEIETEEFIETLSFSENYIGLQLNYDIIKQNDIHHALNLNYEEPKAIGHIIKHHCYDTHDIGKGYFKQDINISKLFYDIKKMINEEDLKIYSSGYCNCYYFYTKNIGYDYNGTSTSVFVVVVNPNFGIISMYPISDTVDKSMLNQYEIEKIEEGKTPKIKSQIDKFNQRYGKM